MVTVSMAVDNGALLQLLCRRRELEAHLKTNIEGRAWLEVLFKLNMDLQRGWVGEGESEGGRGRRGEHIARLQRADRDDSQKD